MNLIAGIIVPVAGLFLWDATTCGDLTLWEVRQCEQNLGRGEVAPRVIILKIWQLTAAGILPEHLAWSLLRLVTGSIIGLILGIGMALAIVRWHAFEVVLSPTIQFLAPVPIVVWVPFLIVIFGIGNVWKIALVGLAVLLVVHVQSVQGFRSIEKRYLEIGDTYEMTWLSKIRHILLPGAAPAILTGLRIGVAISWIGLFVAESAEIRETGAGLGWFIWHQREFGRMEEEFAGVIYLGVAGLVLDQMLLKTQVRILSWRDTQTTSMQQAI